MDGAICHMRWLQKEKTQNTIWKDEMIKYFGDKGISVESLNFISGNMTYEKIWNYIVKQSKDSNDTASHLISTWQDYLSMAKRAKKNINLEKVYKPASIRAAHTDMIAFFAGEDMKKAAAMWGKKYKKVDTVCSELTKYEYKDKKYAIVAPKSILDIVREGTILDHCVHSCDIYYDRMNKRETYLLFLRKAADIDTPWYTLEVEPHGQIRQKRTTGDNQNKDFDEALEFLKKWQRAITKRLSKKDWELGEKSDRLRKEEYKKLRKDGNKIWHGKLAGKLLADVLEVDFMALEEPEQNNQQVV